MTILIAALASTNQPPSLVLFIAFLIGALLFILGFKTYRESRVLTETLETPVRSIPIGLVPVRGKTTGDDRRPVRLAVKNWRKPQPVTRIL